jgi:hypothetical protein
MTDDERLALAERAWMENRHDERAYLLAFARALESRVLAERKQEPIYQVRPRNGEEWTDVSGAEYLICGGAGYLQRIVFAHPTPYDAKDDKERRFEVRQGGMTVAATEGPRKDAYRDAVHYFWQYQQDATEDEPVEMVELITVMRIDAAIDRARQSGEEGK